ncbi:MAG: RluA family pseudouridine synthase [Spirochaetales bacterium]|nr:RluA family pseudouridine synthase [Spirochaetales bacterium]
MCDLASRVLYEDNHIIIVNKLPGEIVQADKTGDTTLADDVKAYLKRKYSKPGNVFLGLPHRLDRPTSGIVVFARTDKALSRLSQMFRDGKVDKFYWAIVDRPMTDQSGLLRHYIYRNTEKNKSFAYRPAADGGAPNLHGIRKGDLQEARLEYRQIGQSERYTLLEIHLLTGRHHQIRAQLAACGVHIKGDLKYGFPRSDENGGICLHSREISFEHPVSHQLVHAVAPVPDDRIWTYFG